MRSAFVLGLLVGVATIAAADSFSDRLNQGAELLRDGNPEAAAAIFEDLYVEHPDSDIVAYSLGVARHDAAKSLMEKDKTQDAASMLAMARTAYGKAEGSTRRDVRDAAAFNKANTFVEMAHVAHSMQDLDQAKANLESAIKDYDTLVEAEPDFDEAKANRAHARYLYRQLIQEQEEQQQQQQQGDDNEEHQDKDKQASEGDKSQQSQEDQGDEQSEQNQDQQNSDQGDQQQQGNQSDDKRDQQQSGDDGQQQQAQDNQNKDGQSQSDEEKDETEHSLQEMADANPQDKTPDEDGQPQQVRQGDPDKPLEHNIEALLQALADQDHRQQQEDMRSSRRQNRYRSQDWW